MLHAGLLRRTLVRRGFGSANLAKATGMSKACVSEICGGGLRLGERREARVKAGLVALGFTPAEIAAIFRPGY